VLGALVARDSWQLDIRALRINDQGIFRSISRLGELLLGISTTNKLCYTTQRQLFTTGTSRSDILHILHLYIELSTGAGKVSHESDLFSHDKKHMRSDRPGWPGFAQKIVHKLAPPEQTRQF
jgi:hypothetical protein